MLRFGLEDDRTRKDMMPAPAQADEAVYTMSEAARLKGVSNHAVSCAIHNGNLAANRIGRQALIRASDLEAWGPMFERRPKQHLTREPDPSVRPRMVLPGNADAAVVTRSVERLLPVLARLGTERISIAGLEDLAATLALILRYSDAALIEWLPGDEGFTVRAATGSERDRLSFQDAGPSVFLRPFRQSGRRGS
jgi:excisionase family DNA binding protein